MMACPLHLLFNYPALLLLKLSGVAQPRLFCVHQRHIYKMLADEPDLQFVGSKNVAHDHIIGTSIVQFIGTFGQLPAMPQDDLVGIEQARNLHRHLFPAPGRTLDARGFSHVGSHGNGDSTEKLYTLGDRIYQFRLLAIMLIEQQVKLIKSWSSNLPVRFLVEITQRHGVGQQKVKLLSHLKANWLFQFKRQHMLNSSVLLNFSGTLVKPRLCVQNSALARRGFRVQIFLGHVMFSLLVGSLTRLWVALEIVFPNFDV